MKALWVRRVTAPLSLAEVPSHLLYSKCLKKLILSCYKCSSCCYCFACGLRGILWIISDCVALWIKIFKNWDSNQTQLWSDWKALLQMRVISCNANLCHLGHPSCLALAEHATDFSSRFLYSFSLHRNQNAIFLPYNTLSCFFPNKHPQETNSSGGPALWNILKDVSHC